MRLAILFLVLGVLAVPCAAVAQGGREYHVSVNGNDTNDGTPSNMLRTISAAALRAQPGDVITVHEGVYREQVSPPRGGHSDAQRIVYQAAPGERAEIKGSEVVTGWETAQNDAWKVTLPNSFFGNFNPYGDLIRGDWFDPRGREHHTGAVYLDGDWLVEATRLEEVLAPADEVPSWLRQAGAQYLLNVAWLQPGGASSKLARIPAAGFAAKNGTQNAECSEGGECIGFILNGHWVRYEGVDFGEKTGLLEMRAASASDGGVIEVRLNAPDGELLGSCAVPNTGGWQSWSSFETKIKPLSGVQTICLVFKSNTPQPVPADVSLWYAKVDDTNTTIWAQFKGVNPNERLVEINVRRTVFYPEMPGINYITVRGFTMRHAATPWAPPTAGQIGLIGTHWSKGWIIENNIVSHSTCSGIALGKYGDEWDNTSANTAEGYVLTIERALANGWNKETVGSHVVRNNTISYCEQTGIVGSLGCSFSTVTGNTIHDIHVRRLFSGAEMSGIKFHGAIDVEIRGNHIFRCCQGIWLDWMAQGARVSGNLFHDNPDQDLFVEVDHGPFVVDNNVFLSRRTLLSLSQGGAYVHNLMAGGLHINPFDGRLTPFHKAHSTELAGMHDNPAGDDRYYNNILVGRADLSAYDDARFPVFMDGNVFLNGAKPSKHEANPLVGRDFDPAVALRLAEDRVSLEIRLDSAWAAARARRLVTTELLGRAAIPNLPYENRDGSPLQVGADYFGAQRNTANPFPGPFECLDGGDQEWTVWPAGAPK